MQRRGEGCMEPPKYECHNLSAATNAWVRQNVFCHVGCPWPVNTDTVFEYIRCLDIFLKKLDNTGKKYQNMKIVLDTPRAGVHVSDFSLLGGKICSTKDTLEL